MDIPDAMHSIHSYEKFGILPNIHTLFFNTSFSEEI